MLELGSSGSMRGVSSNGHPYRDPRSKAVGWEIWIGRGIVKGLPPFRTGHTMSILRLPHFEQTNRSRHSGTVVSAPYRSACSVESGSTRCRQAVHRTMSRTWAAAALPSVIGGPV